jgi:tripartite-type tricarboxylate transporter receptor subunit TctC
MSLSPYRAVFSSCASALFAAATLLCGSAIAEPVFPAKPIRLIVGTPAGSSPDVSARFIAERLTRDLGQPVLVDNKPGASSIIAGTALAAAPGDGYTLFYATAPAISLNPLLYAKLPYKPTEFVPIIHLVDVPFVLSVRADSPYKTVDEVLKAAKQNPDKLTYSTHGEGAPNHVAMLELLQKTGATMTHVPYKDGGVLDVMSGVIDWAFVASADAIPQIKGGKLRALAVSANGRMPSLPGIPALSEGFPGSQLYSWNGVVAPRGTPADVVDRLSTALQKIAVSSEFQQYLLGAGLIPAGGTPGEFRSFLAKDLENWGAVVRRNNIRLDFSGK